MTENKLLFLVVLVFVAMVALVGWVGGEDVRACEARGHSASFCYNLIRP